MHKEKKKSSVVLARTEGFFFSLYRAQLVSEMERSGIELHGLSRTS